MSPPLQTTGGKKRVTLVVCLVVMLVAVACVGLFYHKHTTAKTATHNAEMSKYCIGQNFSTGSSGNCVSDIQTLTNYMEHSGLTECTFDGGATLTVSGNYDQTTADQVKTVQKWSQCYATQEGFKSNVNQTGSVDRPTWGELCTFGYTDPSQSKAADAAASIAAGNDAGCAQLHK